MSTPLIPAATLILLKDTQNGLQTLLLQRQAKASFLPDAWVFPGGKLEQQDEQGDAWHNAKHAATRETQEEAGIALSVQQLVPFSRWLAPIEAPKRFDTYFFLAEVEQTAVTLQQQEVVKSRWLSPKEALEQHQQQALNIIPPTVVSLAMLENFDSAKQAIAYFSQQNAPVFAPKVCSQDQQIVMLYDGDSAYHSGDLNHTGKLHRCVLKGNAWHYVKQD